MPRSNSLVTAASVFASFGLGIAACGGTSASTFNDPNTTNGSGVDGGNGGTFGGTSAEAGNDPRGTKAACVSATANAALTPANLVFMFDKSGSMGDQTPTNPANRFDPALKWNPVTTGMKAFFTDPGSAGLNASLQFFPLPVSGNLEPICDFDYATPLVKLTPLTDSAPFVSAIDGMKPEGGTPTLPAINGAIAYAKKLNAERPTEKAVIVLVTDGEPGVYNPNTRSFDSGCPGNTVAGVASAAAKTFKGSPSIPTYVIGIGSDIDAANANTMAAAGGTSQALMVSVADPAKTNALFVSKLDAIRAQNVSCDFALPTPPSGKTLDIKAVNVAFINGAAVETDFAYSSDCSTTNGWHYDNITAPTKIELCPASCQLAESDRAGKITIAFGCATNGIVK